jgi:AraC-like DNA-binding protein
MSDHPTNCLDRRAANINVVFAQTSPHRVDTLKRLAIQSGNRSVSAILHLMRGSPGHGRTELQDRAEAYAACLHLEPLDAYDVWCEERHVASRAFKAGATHINDMRHVWAADIRSPFKVVNFYIPQHALDEISDEQGASRIEELRCPMSQAPVDAVLKHLALALLPALNKPQQASRLFTEYALRTVTLHLMKTYGSLRFKPQSVRGGLAPWQEYRVKEMLSGCLSGNLSVSELASACNLSPGYFIHAFKQTAGCPPYQWLLQQRVDRAKQLMLNTHQSLSEIALAAGFADQSHLTRVFSQRVKVSPAAWRRAQGG